MRRLGAIGAVLGVLAFAPSAQAIDTAFGNACTAQASQDNVRLCSGEAATFDGTEIDTNVFLPPAPGGGAADGPYPVIGIFHGWGGSKLGFNNDPRIKQWALDGYAVFSMSDRGWGQSCGALDPDRANPAVCGEGYNHLMDTRFEVRDAQFLFGRLADEGIIVPDRIGATGGSYGGGMSMALAALRNRVMEGALPGETVGNLVPWTSPNGKAMQIAVAAPEIPWTDLAYALLPNGRTLDYVADAPYRGPDGKAPIGVAKTSWIELLYAAGLALSNYAPPGTDPAADLTQWFAFVNAGEPYDENPQANTIVNETTKYHSSYYIPTSGGYYGEGPTPPAPLLISNGFTDDLFPVDEATRFYNRTRAVFPGNDISLYYLDYGHARGQGKDADEAKLRAAQEAWFDHYLKGIGPRPDQGATAITQTCPGTAASKGPFTAPTWDELSPGEVRLVSEPAKTIQPVGGSPQDGQAFDPIAGGGDPCESTNGSDKPGTASYRMEPAKGTGFTLMGSPTVIADITSPGPHSQIAARLLDVAPDGNQTLVARGLYRPEPSGRQVFQLHANGWEFSAGHVAKLELLPNDSPYGRPTNGQAPVTVANLDLRLPVLERSGAGIGTPQPSFVPGEFRPAPGIQAAGPCETGLAKKGTRRKDRIKGTQGGDRLQGRKGNDRINGRKGDDCVAGNKGNDRLRGAKGKDKLRGGKGKDRINSKDRERDRVSCGAGKRDRVVADKKDKLSGCERKRRR